MIDENLLKKENLTNRLNSLIMIYSNSKKEEFPKSLVMYGYGSIHLGSREELLFRIKELCSLLGIELKEEI